MTKIKNGDTPNNKGQTRQVCLMPEYTEEQTEPNKAKDEEGP